MKHFCFWIYLRFLEKEHFAMFIVHSASNCAYAKGFLIQPFLFSPERKL